MSNMGINGLLPRILPSAGRENYDLRALQDGIIVSLLPSTAASPDDGHQQPPSKRLRRTNVNTNTNTNTSFIRRKVRIAVDVNGWISRAAHGYGGTLMDERHLSYHGRAQLLNQQEQQQQQDQIQAQQRLEYIQKIVSFTLKKIESMRDECSALVLPVLDGNTPPCKLDVVRERSARRKRAVEERDQSMTQGVDNEHDNAADGGTDNDDINEAARTEAEVLRKISKSKQGGMGKDYSMRRDILAELLNEFRKRKWPFLVAPYEADGQLAYLANTGAVDVVVTEDSDLIGLGVPTLIYKLGGWNGSNAANRGAPAFGTSGSSSSSSSSHLGTILHRRDLGSAHDIDLIDFSDAMLATMFVAAGCDYCANLKGIGVVTARNIVKKAFHGWEADSEVVFNSLMPRSDEPVLRKVLHGLFSECSKDARKELLPPGKAEVRLAYERKFLAALAMYRHPLVFDPIQGVHLVANDVSGDSESPSASVRSRSTTFSKDEKILMEYEPYRNLVMNRELLYEVIGTPSSPEIAKGIAEGIIDPRQLPNENDDTVIEDEGQNGEDEGEASTQPSSELLSSQDFSGAGTQSKFSQSSTSEGLSSPDLLTSPSSAVKGLLV
jgi:5'-3' exonuclease